MTTTEAWDQVVLDGSDAAVRAFVTGFLAGRGEDPNRVLFAADAGVETESLGERLKHLLRHGAHHALFVPAALADALTAALERVGERVGIGSVHRRRTTAASFDLQIEVFSRDLANDVKAALAGRPAGVVLEDWTEAEEVAPDAGGIELYAPAHPYTYRTSAHVTGPLPGVLVLHERLVRLTEGVGVGAVQVSTAD